MMIRWHKPTLLCFPFKWCTTQMRHFHFKHFTFLRCFKIQQRIHFEAVNSRLRVMVLPVRGLSMKCSKLQAWESRFLTASCQAAKLAKASLTRWKQRWKPQLESSRESRELFGTWSSPVVVLDKRKNLIFIAALINFSSLTSSFLPRQSGQIDITSTWAHNGAPLATILCRGGDLRVNRYIGAVKVLAGQSVEAIAWYAISGWWLIRNPVIFYSVHHHELL